MVIEPPILKDSFLNQSISLMDSVKSVYNQEIGAAASDDELTSIYDAIDIGKDLVENYQAMWKWPYLEGVQVISVEESLVAPVPDTEYFLKGKLDAIIEDNLGRKWVVEHKTYSMRPRADALDSNNQFLAYIWLARQFFTGIAGIAYDGIWKKSKPSKGEHLDSLFCRMTLTRPDVEVGEFERMLSDEVMDMAYVIETNAIYHNRRWEGCYDCQYEALCRAQSKGDDIDYQLGRFTKGVVIADGE